MYLTPANALGIMLAGAVTGVLGAILGTGGGVFLIPILVLALGMPMHFAVATSILSVIATSSAVASTNVERGTANMRLGMTLEVATALGAITGGLTAGWLRPRVLEGLFALVLLPTAILMWRGCGEHAAGATGEGAAGRTSGDEGPHRLDDSLGALGARYRDESEGGIVAYRVERLGAGLAISFLAGNLSGLLGIGGGVFKVPALNLVCRVPIKAAAATSNFMIGVTAAASALLYYGRGEVRPALSAATVLGVLAGSALGSILNRKVGGRAVRRLFAVLLLAVSAQMLYRAFLARG
ncbi:MAG TPA: sulfite exporter TauE/SafE family protein [Isosphaeraceae bacterium]|nr:sulfite exporter TauE/SafE family protein [Isosphaeraceae bacterium]